MASKRRALYGTNEGASVLHPGAVNAGPRRRQTSQTLSRLHREVAADPSDVDLRVKLTLSLFEAGLGDAAREEALASVATDDKSDRAWVMLAAAYQCDSFARPFQGNWDPVESERAIRRTLELTPNQPLGRLNLAALYDQIGRRDEAIAIYKELVRQPLQLAPAGGLLVIDYLRTGRVTAARESMSLADKDTAPALKIALEAIEHDVAAAIASAASSEPDPAKRAKNLLGAAGLLADLRRYQVAAGLATRAASLAQAGPMSALADVLGMCRRREENALPPADPKAAVQQIILETMRKGLTTGSATPFLSRRAGKIPDEILQQLNHAAAEARQMLAGMGLSGETLVDYVASMLAFDQAGDAAQGFRVTAMPPGTPKTFSFYLLPEGGKFKIAGVADGWLGPVGGLIAERLAAGDQAAAEWWLDRIAADIPRSPIARLWPKKTQPRPPVRMRLVTHAITGASTGSATDLTALEAARADTKDVAQQRNLDEAICAVLLAQKNWRKLMETAHRVDAGGWSEKEGMRYFTRAANETGAWKELEAEATTVLDLNLRRGTIARDPATDLLAWRTIVLAKFRQDPAADVSPWLDRITASKEKPGANWLFAAWVQAAQHRPSEQTLEKLRDWNFAGVDIQDRLYGAAMLESELGRLEEAERDLTRAIGSRELEWLPAEAWAVHAIICEKLGYSGPGNATRKRAAQIARENPDRETSFWVTTMMEK